MRIGQQIEEIRRRENIPVYEMCNILNISSEREYHDICMGRVKLTTFQLVMFILITECSLDL